MSSNNNTANHNNTDPPMFIVSLCLFIAVTICSSAGTAFNELTSVQNVPPFLAAFWRLFLQNIVQFIPFVISLHQVWKEDEERKAVRHWNVEGGLLFDVEVEKIDRENSSNDDNNDDYDDYDRQNNEKAELLNSNNNNDDDEAKKDVSMYQSMSSRSNEEENIEQKKANVDNDARTTIDNELILPKYIRSMPLLFLSGFALGTHFSMWVYSLRHTSITHSLLWVSMGPIVLNFSSWALFIISTTVLATTGCCSWWCCSSISIGKFNKPSWLETLGAILGIGGAVIMLIDTANVSNTETTTDGEVSHDNNGSHPPSVHGDVAAFTGAVAVCIYLVIGKKLRSWLPIWLYMFPVIGFASLTCLTYALLDNYDETTWIGMTNASVFGLFALPYLPYVLYLGIGPGIFGHTMLSALLKYISPLIVSTAMLSEPIMGSIIGHLFGMQPMPQMYTWIGGMVLMIGLVLVVVGESG